MLIKNLAQQVLVDPAKEDCTDLFIVSGYAAATMAYRQLELLNNIKKRPEIKLIIGMCATEGISRSNHLAFRRLIQHDYKHKFECRYLFKKPPVHSKVYTWIKNGEPYIGYIGSANYTQNGFGPQQRECLAINEPSEGLALFSALFDETIDCLDDKVEKHIEIFEDKRIFKRKKKEVVLGQEKAIVGLPGLQLPHVAVSILDKHGKLPLISGLNWGQRLGREPNQAYIRLTSKIYHTDFFPPIGIRFTLLTDDNEIFICARAQANGKAIHTPENNSLIGKYFRKRLGIAQSAPVRLTDVLKYGRVDIDFYKLDEESFYMDFSSKKNG